MCSQVIYTWVVASNEVPINPWNILRHNNSHICKTAFYCFITQNNCFCNAFFRDCKENFAEKSGIRIMKMLIMPTHWIFNDNQNKISNYITLKVITGSYWYRIKINYANDWKYYLCMRKKTLKFIYIWSTTMIFRYRKFILTCLCISASFFSINAFFRRILFVTSPQKCAIQRWVNLSSNLSSSI